MENKLNQILSEILSLKEKVGKVEVKFDEKFDKVDERLNNIDDRLDGMDQRFDFIDEKFNQIDQRFDFVDEKLESLEESQDNLMREVRSNTNYIVKTIKEHRIVIDLIQQQINPSSK
ncbi:hypothetical protein [Peribacillus acanthi]|uniref:hypothetical protein n=1 Tax=Peribacillus acanthi TaxID=2171554 RepID=UPI000D3E2C2E|nr:hypothetical protein [Peribacillus acanthi]